MPNLSPAALESATRIVYAIEDLPGDLKVYWSKWVQYFFSSVLRPAQLEQREILSAAKPLYDSQKLQDALATLSPDDVLWIAASLRQLSVKATDQADWIANRNILKTLDLLLIRLDLDTALQLPEKQQSLAAEFEQFQNRKTFQIHGSLLLIVIDFVCRWALLIAFNSEGFSAQDGALVGFNILLSFPLIGIFYVISKRINTRNKLLITRLGFEDNYRIRVKYSTFQYTIVVLFIVIGVVVSGLVYPDSVSLGMGLALLMLAYYAWILAYVPAGKINEADLMKQMHEVSEEHGMDADKNDEAIVALETKISSSAGRLEAYVLESALFGALSFSGFLQIIATDSIKFSDLENFANAVYIALHGFVNANWAEFNQSLTIIETKVGLFCLVSVETLMCSGFFLAVIASRLRFSDVADKVRHALSMAKAYNAKEEILLGDEDRFKLRLDILNEKVRLYVAEAMKMLDRIDPIVGYMQYFRNAGILLFLIVLITSSLFISKFLALSFFVIMLATLFYFNFVKINSLASSSRLQFRILFSSKTYLFLAIAVSPVFLAYFFRIVFGFVATDWLIAVGFILLGLYFSIWLVLMPHNDEAFGDIENLPTEAWRSSRWRVVKNIYGALIILIAIATSFKLFHLKGSNELLLIGNSAICIVNYAVGYYLSRPRWVGIFVAMLTGTAVIGILFKLLHLAGANMMISVSLVAQVIFYVIYFVRRKSFHVILLRISIVNTIVTLLFLPLFGIIVLFSLAYDHRTLNVAHIQREEAPIYNEIGDASLSLEEKTKLSKESIEAFDRYLALYCDGWGATIYTGPMRYYGSAIDNLLYEFQENPKKDTATLFIALAYANEMNKVDSVFRYSEARSFLYTANVLEALGRRKEAIQMLERFAEGNYPADVKASAGEALAALKSR